MHIDRIVSIADKIASLLVLGLFSSGTFSIVVVSLPNFPLEVITCVFFVVCDCVVCVLCKYVLRVVFLLNGLCLWLCACVLHVFGTCMCCAVCVARFLLFARCSFRRACVGARGAPS